MIFSNVEKQFDTIYILIINKIVHNQCIRVDTLYQKVIVLNISIFEFVIYFYHIKSLSLTLVHVFNAPFVEFNCMALQRIKFYLIVDYFNVLKISPNIDMEKIKDQGSKGLIRVKAGLNRIPKINK